MYFQSPHSHLKGKIGCKICYPDKSLTVQDWMERFLQNTDYEGNSYLYPNITFPKAHDKIEIVCRIHGIFHQRVYAHANQNQGCPTCSILRNADRKRSTIDHVLDVFKKSHDADSFDYSRVYNSYKSMADLVEIGCKICGAWFNQQAGNHAAGAGCPNCKWDFTLRKNKRERAVVDGKIAGKIYKIICKPNGKIYIGQAFRKRPHDRVNSHFLESETNPHLRASVQKYGKDAFEWEWIDEAFSVLELNEKESFWIKQLNPNLDQRIGYNLNYGGDGSYISESTRRKLSAKARGRKHSEKVKMELSERMSGENNPMYGKHPKRKGKGVIRSDGISFNTLTEAASSVNVSKSYLGKALKNGWSAGGYTWEYIST